MKKLIYFILSIFVIYVLWVFLFPKTLYPISEKLWLTWFNKWVIAIRKDFNDFITNFDVFSKYGDTKDKTLEIKQNIETQVNDTKTKIEEVQNNVDNVTNSITETKDSINKTVDSINQLQNSVVNVAIPANSWSVKK